MKISPQETATLVFDESGTPALGVNGDGVFVVGGFVIRGDEQVVAQAWEQVRRDHISTRKGNAYTDAELQALADFLVERTVLPISSHAVLTEDDRCALEEKVSWVQLGSDPLAGVI